MNPSLTETVAGAPRGVRNVSYGSASFRARSREGFWQGTVVDVATPVQEDPGGAFVFFRSVTERLL